MKHAPQHEPQPVALSGVYRQPIFSPRGGLEGVLLEIDGAPVQVVLDPHDDSESFAALAVGQKLKLEASPTGPSPKGEAAHAVYRFHAWTAALRGKSAELTTFRGKVTRFNYAKHGEPNGVVLDSGDFIHLRPDGFRVVGLSIGDDVQAEGISQPMMHGGRVVEATRVNDRVIEPKKSKPNDKKHEHPKH